MKKVKVKSLAEKFGLSPKDILAELQSQGIDVSSAGSIVPEDMLELVEELLEDIQGEIKQKKKIGKTSKTEPEEVHIKPPVIVKSLAEALGKKPNEIISDFMSMGVFSTINQAVTDAEAEALCEKYNIRLLIDRRGKAVAVALENEAKEEKVSEEEYPEDVEERPPIVTFLGHVDHGKTSLQDKIRNTNVADGEAGKITQHIGASTVAFHGKKITFIDTPGHEAFTQMRARGANVTDIAILVVAADDGFMPQTVEALTHARAAGVPIIIAINKIDLPDANPDKIILQMQQNGLTSEDWGGETGTVRVSAKTGEGLDRLLERILLEAEILELKASSRKKAKGIVLEAQLEQGHGPTANVLIQSGTLKIGDMVLCDEYYGRVKALLNAHGERINSAGPSEPVKLVGLSGVPNAGSKLKACANEREAKQEAEARAIGNKHSQLEKQTGQTLDDLFSRLSEANRNNLSVIIKADVQGSAEAIIDSLKKLPSDKISVEIIMSGVGAITENDVMLAAASDAVVIGFHVRVNAGVNTIAKQQNVEIRLYSIIYELLEDIRDALSGRLEPLRREIKLGNAKILQIFALTKGPKICGCQVENGLVRVGAKARVFRNNELIYNGSVLSLRRFHDDVKEVRAGLECGIRLDNFVDFVENDNIEFYDIELHKATL